MRLKNHLQYERDFCNYIEGFGFHAERVAASGRRTNSICDCIIFKGGRSWFVEVKSTKKPLFRFGNEQKSNLLEVSNKTLIRAVLAVYFKGNRWKTPKWVLKLLTNELFKVGVDEASDSL